MAARQRQGNRQSGVRFQPDTCDLPPRLCCTTGALSRARAEHARQGRDLCRQSSADGAEQIHDLSRLASPRYSTEHSDAGRVTAHPHPEPNSIPEPKRPPICCREHRPDRPASPHRTRSKRSPPHHRFRGSPSSFPSGTRGMHHGSCNALRNNAACSRVTRRSSVSSSTRGQPLSRRRSRGQSVMSTRSPICIILPKDRSSPSALQGTMGLVMQREELSPSSMSISALMMISGPGFSS